MEDYCTMITHTNCQLNQSVHAHVAAVFRMCGWLILTGATNWMDPSTVTQNSSRSITI